MVITERLNLARKQAAAKKKPKNHSQGRVERVQVLYEEIT